jgi:hypothetical protein
MSRVSPNFTDQHIQDGWFALTQIGEGEKKIGEIAIQLGFKVNETKGVCWETLMRSEISKH